MLTRKLVRPLPATEFYSLGSELCCVRLFTAQVCFDFVALSAREDELANAAEKAARAMDEV